MLNDEFNSLFKFKYKNSKELKTLIIRYKRAHDEDKKIQIRDEIFYNVARFMRRVICSSSIVSIENRDEVFNSAFIEFDSCLKNYRISRGSFLTYLHYWIMRSVYDYRSNQNVIKVSSYNDASEENKVKVANGWNSSLIYLDKKIEMEDGAAAVFQLPDPKAEKNIIEPLEAENVMKFLKENLNPSQVIILRFRCLSDEPWSLDDLGVVFKKSRERIRQLEERAKYELRKSIENKGFSFKFHYFNKNEFVPTEEELMAYDKIFRERRMKEKLEKSKRCSEMTRGKDGKMISKLKNLF